MMQVDNLEKFLAWVKSSPCQFTVSSMSGGYVHVKFLVPCDKAIGPNEAEQFYKSFTPTPRDQWHREVKEADAIEDAILGDEDKYRKGYADGVQEVIGYVRSELDHFGG